MSGVTVFPTVGSSSANAISPSIRRTGEGSRWRFRDPYSDVIYDFEVSPNEGGSPARKRNITTTPTTAPKGKALIFEGSQEPATLNWSGILLGEDQLNVFKEWYDKRHQILLTDDLGRSFYLYITHFEFKRIRAAHHSFKHSYTADAILLDWLL